MSIFVLIFKIFGIFITIFNFYSGSKYLENQLIEKDTMDVLRSTVWFMNSMPLISTILLFTFNHWIFTIPLSIVIIGHFFNISLIGGPIGFLYILINVSVLTTTNYFNKPILSWFFLLNIGISLVTILIIHYLSWFILKFTALLSFKRKIPKKQKEIIQKLNLILKCLFIVLLDIYKSKFPNDFDENNMHRAGVILNELVLYDLSEDQAKFKKDNIDFIRKEKDRVIKCENINRGIISFLKAKGALYKTWNHPKASIWIDEARRLQQNVIIPTTLSEISKEIYNCVKYYRENTVVGEMNLDW